MTSKSIPSHQRKQVEEERRNSLARYLIHLDSQRQQLYLHNLKSDEQRADLQNRMREQLAIEISLLDTNIRNLRLADLNQKCERKRNGQQFFQDVLKRVNHHLEQRKAQHG